jgi:hypothetical protein
MSRSKKLRKHIQGHLRTIAEHYAKIKAEYDKLYPSYQDIRKWEQDIEQAPPIYRRVTQEATRR